MYEVLRYPNNVDIKLFVLFPFRILETLSLLAEKIGCYKVNINCTREMMQFCEKLKLVYEPGENIMELKFPKNCDAINKSML